MSTFPSTLHKEERIYSKKLIDALFQGGHSHSMSAFPLRVVYMQTEGQDGEGSNLPQSRFLISVPKRCFKRAVRRNRVKRQVREAYRRHKSLVADYPVALAFIWLDSHLRTTEEVESRMVNLLKRVSERLHQKEKLRQQAPQPEEITSSPTRKEDEA
ncbi:MAG: ribonuclease P protein component [Prevotella sp.]|nr:ribonuclease P protein component [Prevotella sp.]